MVNICPCACWTSICLLWKNVCLGLVPIFIGLVPIFKSHFYFLILSYSLCILCIIRLYMICKYFLLFSWLPFHFADGFKALLIFSSPASFPSWNETC